MNCMRMMGVAVLSRPRIVVGDDTPMHSGTISCDDHFGSSVHCLTAESLRSLQWKSPIENLLALTEGGT